MITSILNKVIYLQSTKTTKMNGYEQRIVEQCTKSAYLNKRSIKSAIINLLYKEIRYNKKSQAIAVLDKVGDRFYTEETYERAAEMLLAKR